ncbi:MAG: WYL domain-containing protein [Bacteroidaceae bacterium]
MEASKLDKQLKLMILLTQNKEYTADMVCEQMDLHRRTFYRYLEQFRQMGFEVEKDGRCYRLDKRSPFFQKITEMIHFSESEAVVIRNALNAISDKGAEVRHLQVKLARLYDFDILKKHKADQLVAENISKLYQAIKLEQTVVFRNYSSSNSNQLSDRIVEPYLFMAENAEIRCYEVSSHQNKTFKVARIGGVDTLDLLWANKANHRSFYTDLFHFSGEERTPVTLLLGRLSANLLKEEYPNAAELLTPTNEGQWLLTTEVCSFKGVGRFILGLWEDIEVVAPLELMAYLRKKVALLTQKIGE